MGQNTVDGDTGIAEVRAGESDVQSLSSHTSCPSKNESNPTVELTQAGNPEITGQGLFNVLMKTSETLPSNDCG